MTDKGFTLVEVMIGMAIFLIGFLAVGTMQIAAVNGNAGAREATEAATRATDQLETLIALPYDSIVERRSGDRWGLYRFLGRDRC